VSLQDSRLQLKCDGTRWRMGGEVRGKMANVVGSQYPSHYLGTWCIQHYYRWMLSIEMTPPGRFKWTRPFHRKTKCGFCACAITFQTQSKTGFCAMHASNEPLLIALTWKIGWDSIHGTCVEFNEYYWGYWSVRRGGSTYRSFATKLSQLKICDFSGETFKGFEVL